MSGIFDSIKRFFHFMVASSSPEANDINSIFIKFLFIAGFIALLIAGGVVIGAIRYRSSKRPGEPPQISGSKKLEIAWTILPFVAVTFFFVLAVHAMRQINQPFPEGREPDIIITAHQWWWDMRYPKYEIITANELHIPVRENMLARIESADVIHDWWVPALGRKIDAIPGHINYTWIDADTVGTYSGTCAEYCGAQHAHMRITVIAQPLAEFQQWVDNQQEVPPTPADSLAREGAIVFQRNTCAGCHAIAGTPANSHIGPDLTHFASRGSMLSSMMPNTEQNLIAWLKNPQAVKKGAHMPNFRLSQDKLKALVAYLEELK